MTQARPNPPPAPRHTLAVLMACVLWGTTGTVAHFAPDGTSQMLVGLATFGFGGLILFALDARPVLGLLRERAAWPRLIAGMLGVFAYAGMYYESMHLVGVAIGNVLALGSGPVFAALLELAVDRRLVSRVWLAATAVAVLGITLLALSAGHGDSGTGTHALLGVLLGLGAGFGYALYSYAGAGLIAHGHASRSVMAAIFTLSAVVLVPTFFMLDPGPLLSARGGVILAYLALLPMAAAYLFFGYGLRALSASTATTLALAEPLVATLLATVILQERLTGAAWIGLALILAGIVLLAVAEQDQPAIIE